MARSTVVSAPYPSLAAAADLSRTDAAAVVPVEITSL
jgi:hypothetical protein